MSYCTVSNWSTTAWTKDMEELARNKYVPMVMGVGASRIQMIRTSDRSFTVVTEYKDEATAMKAQARIDAIRAEAAQEMPMSMDSKAGGAVFAGG